MSLWSRIYTRINWRNNVSGGTPLNETNLNKMDYALDAIDQKVYEIDRTKLEATDVAGVFKNVSINDSTGVITFTRYDNSTTSIDTKLEKVVTNFYYDSANRRLVLTLEDGTHQYVPMSDFINVYTFNDSAQLDFQQSNYNVTAIVKNNSITEAMLDTDMISEMRENASICENAEDYVRQAFAVGNMTVNSNGHLICEYSDLYEPYVDHEDGHLYLSEVTENE